MKLLDLRFAVALMFTSALAACGGGADSAPSALADAPAQAIVAAAAGPQPQPDCAADGCSVPRIIDGLAEQYRADAMARPQPALQDEAADNAGQPPLLATQGADSGAAPEAPYGMQ